MAINFEDTHGATVAPGEYTRDQWLALYFLKRHIEQNAGRWMELQGQDPNDAQLPRIWNEIRGLTSLVCGIAQGEVRPSLIESFADQEVLIREQEDAASPQIQ